MTTRYCGIGGNDANDGLSWANRKLTLNGVEDTPVASGDIVYVGPGVYRELLTLDVSGASEIAYIADVTGEHTDGVGGQVRITGSDNDQTGARNNCIVASAKNYRTFRGFRLDGSLQHTINATNCSNWILEDCTLDGINAGSQYLVLISGTGTSWTMRRCVVLGTAVAHSIYITHTSTVDNAGHLFENCLFMGQQRLINTERVGGITVKNCSFLYCGTGIRIGTAISVGQTIIVNNCLFHACSTALQATVTGEITEDYNNFYGCGTNRTNTATGSNSVSYATLLQSPLLLSGIKFPWQFGELSQWSALRRIAGTGMSTNDQFGITRPATDSKKSWGAIQFRDVQRETGTTRTGGVSMKLADAGEHQIFVPVSNESTVFSCYVYREADYTGTAPQMIIKQPGQSDTTVTDAAAASQWNQLTTTLTPAASPPYVVVVFKSNNTATSGNYDVFVDDFTVS